MPQPIIVGYDGSDHGADALALGRALASQLAARLIVVTAYTPEEWLWAPGTANPLDAEGRRQVAERAEALLGDAADVEMRTVASPSAAGALYSEAEREGAQMIVVGTTHHGTVGRMLLGTVTQEVLDAAPCAVAVASPGLASAHPLRLSRIGTGFDDSAEAHEALGVAASLARRAGAHLDVIWAAHLAGRAMPVAFAGYLHPNYFEEMRVEVQERLERAAAPLRGQLAVRTEVVSGQTTRALVKESEHLDLLVLGSRGYGPLKRVLLGSVSRAVASAAHCPVLVVPRGMGTLEPGEPAEAVGESAGNAAA